MHVCYHTLAYSLLFLSNSFFLSKFSSPFSLFFLIPLWGYYVHSCFSLPLFRSPCCCFCTRWRALLYYLPWRVFTVLPLNYFCLGVGVLLDHPLVCQLLSHHHLPVLVVPHPITRQTVLFCLLVHRGIPIRIREGIFSHYPSWHAPSDSNLSFPLLSGMSF